MENGEWRIVSRESRVENCEFLLCKRQADERSEPLCGCGKLLTSSASVGLTQHHLGI